MSTKNFCVKEIRFRKAWANQLGVTFRMIIIDLIKCKGMANQLGVAFHMIGIIKPVYYHLLVTAILNRKL